MAARFWAQVLSVQLALAVVIALAAKAGSWDGVLSLLLLTIAIFVGLQYAVVALTIVLSRALAPANTDRGSLSDALRAAISEPIYFGLAQWSMIAARGARPSAFIPPEAPGGGGGQPILLVHGLACNRGVWRWMIPELRAAGFESVYAMDLLPFRADIDVLAEQFERELRRIQYAHGNSTVTIIAHSMGGLVARSALRASGVQGVRRLITIATPHHGAAIARTLSWIPAKQMCLASPWLATFDAPSEGRPPLPMACIGSPDDNLVRPASSAYLPGATAREVRGLGHFGLLISKRAIACVLHALEHPS